MNIRVPTCFWVGQIANYLNLLDPGWKIGQIEAVFCQHTENKSYALWELLKMKANGFIHF